MAQTFLPSTKTWVITTAATDIDKNDLRVAGIRWVGATTGNTVVIQNRDTSPATMWESVGATANFIDTDNAKRRWPNGFSVSMISGGTLYVLLE